MIPLLGWKSILINMLKIAIVRGRYLNQYEMQSYEPLSSKYSLTGFGSLTSYHDKFVFPATPSNWEFFPDEKGTGL